MRLNTAGTRGDGGLEPFLDLTSSHSKIGPRSTNVDFLAKVAPFSFHRWKWILNKAHSKERRRYTRRPTSFEATKNLKMHCSTSTTPKREGLPRRTELRMLQTEGTSKLSRERLKAARSQKLPAKWKQQRIQTEIVPWRRTPDHEMDQARERPSRK